MVESWVHSLAVVAGSLGLPGATHSAKWPKMVFGNNLHHMAPFGILEAGFCMVFRPASFWFLVPGTHFWTPEPKFGSRNQNLDPGFGDLAPAGLGRFWEGKLGLEKHGFVEVWFRKWRLGEIP